MDGSARTMEDQAPNALATGRIGSLLMQYSIPAIIATTAASLYNIIDRVFIGHGVGPMAISGLALTFPLMNLAASLGALVGAGGASLVSIRLGERNRPEANAILGNTIFLNSILGVGFSIVFLAFLDTLLRVMGGSPETLPYAKSFMQVILCGNVFTHLYLGLTHLMRASGHPRKAMVITLLTVAINLALAPLFIFVLHWGIRGAALATVCAQMVGSLVAFLHFTQTTRVVHLKSRYLRPRLKIIGGIFSIGMSNFTTLFCASMVAVIVNLRLARYGGDYAIGAFGIINTLATFFVMIAVGVNLGMQPIAGFNFGARQFDRVVRVYRYAVVAASGVTLIGFLLAELFPRAVARAFTGDAVLIEQSVTGMRLLFLCFPMVGFQITTSSLFQSIGKAKISVLLSLSRQVIFLIPFLLLLPLGWGLKGVWCAEPAADLSASIVAFFVLKARLRKDLSQTPEAAAGSALVE
jgi:putative MATE family efflux protein